LYKALDKINPEIYGTVRGYGKENVLSRLDEKNVISNITGAISDVYNAKDEADLNQVIGRLRYVIYTYENFKNKTFFEQGKKLLDEIDEIKTLPFDEKNNKIKSLCSDYSNKYLDYNVQTYKTYMDSMKNVDVSPGQIEALWKINMQEYDVDWLRENTETFIEYKNLDNSIDDVITYMRTTAINAENIKDTVNKVKQMIQERNSIDFAFNEGSDFFSPDSHKWTSLNTFSTGYQFLDIVSGGGFAAKTLTCFVGQAKIGKCGLGTEYIYVRGKKTGLIKKITLKEFHEYSMQIMRSNT